MLDASDASECAEDIGHRGFERRVADRGSCALDEDDLRFLLGEAGAIDDAFCPR